MPLYDFTCTVCGYEMEHLCPWRRREEGPPIFCPMCQSLMERQYPHRWYIWGTKVPP